MKTQRLVGLFLLGCLLLNYPLLSLVNRARAVMGIPIMYLWLFAVWGLLIALMAIVVERSGNRNGD
ncbi:MAG TPA: hypothetical protein VJ302_22765 [Blastocatellia bacterium]|nr:hypothetical protein [Blastocatellia bacterium]